MAQEVPGIRALEQVPRCARLVEWIRKGRNLPGNQPTLANCGGIDDACFGNVESPCKSPVAPFPGPSC